jgi:hypothetical protein
VAVARRQLTVAQSQVRQEHREAALIGSAAYGNLGRTARTVIEKRKREENQLSQEDVRYTCVRELKKKKKGQFQSLLIFRSHDSAGMVRV